MESMPATRDETLTIEPPGISPSPSPRARWHVYGIRALIWIGIVAMLVMAFREGLHLRRWVFDTSDPMRFISDDQRGVYWGLVATGPEGYLNQYDKMEPQLPDWQDSNWVPWLDYAPLRLLVMREWAAWQRVHFPPDPHRDPLDQWQRPYAFNAWPLTFNICQEGIAAVCAFFLTRLWVIRGNGGKPAHHFEGIWQGIVAALMIWFSLDIILSAHAWIQWDSWIIPWYLCAALLASIDWWFVAGLAIAVGAMFKAQQLAVAPIFIIWPLVQCRFGAAMRWINGLVLGIALIVSPWMLTYLPAGPLAAARAIQDGLRVSNYPPDLFQIPRNFDAPAAIWIAEMILLAWGVPSLLRHVRPQNPPTQESQIKTILYSQGTWTAAAAALIFAAAYWPFLLHNNRPYWYLGLAGGAALAACSLFLQRRKLFYVLAAALGGGLLSCMLLFHGGVGWAKCALEYGTNHWPYLIMGTTSNIPGLFELRFGWPHEAIETAFTLPAIHAHWPSFFIANGWWPATDVDVSEKTLFNTIYAFFLVLSGIAIGLQARRNDRRMLVALVTPWIMFFLLPVQIHERYLLFASGAAACCIGAGVGPALLGYLLTLFSSMMFMNRMLDLDYVDLNKFGQNLADTFPHIFSQESGRTILQYVSNTHPDIAWGVTVVALVFLYLSLTPSPRFKRRAERSSGV